MRTLCGRFHSSSLPASTPSTTFYGPLLDQTNVPSTPLSSSGNLLFALGLRKLRAAYTGPALRIYCATASPTSFDVNFNSDGTLNVSLIATTCGSSPGYVTKWYDQSGNACDFTASNPTDVTKMYRIWSGTAIDTLTNSSSVAIPCIKAINTNSDLISAAFTAQTNTQLSAFLVASLENTVTSIGGRMLTFYGATNTDSSDAEGISFTRSGSATPAATWSIARNPNNSGPIANLAGAYSDVVQVDFSANDPTYQVNLEGVAGTAATGTQSAFAYTHAALGYSGNTHASVGEFFEIVAYNTNPTSTQLTAIRTNQAGYWATSSASNNPSGGSPTGSGSGATNLPGWKLDRDEGFDTPASAGQFLSKYPDFTAYSAGTPDTWALAHGGGSQYGTNNITVANSILNVQVYCDNSGSYGAAIIAIPPGETAYQGHTYYRREARVRCLSPVAWQKEALLLWSDSNTWNEGEVDFPENNLNGNVQGFNHHPGNPSVADNYSGSFDLSQWHVYAIEWTAGKLVWLIDGTVVKTITSNVPSTSFHDVLQIERVLTSTPAPVAGQSCNWQCDYFRQWLPA